MSRLLEQLLQAGLAAEVPNREEASQLVAELEKEGLLDKAEATRVLEMLGTAVSAEVDWAARLGLARRSELEELESRVRRLERQRTRHAGRTDRETRRGHRRGADTANEPDEDS